MWRSLLANQIERGLIERSVLVGLIVLLAIAFAVIVAVGVLIMLVVAMIEMEHIHHVAD